MFIVRSQGMSIDLPGIEGGLKKAVIRSQILKSVILARIFGALLLLQLVCVSYLLISGSAFTEV